MTTSKDLNFEGSSVYVPFSGSYVTQMPQLRKRKLLPLTVHDIAEKIINSAKQGWKTDSFFTPDGVGVYGDRIKVARNCDLLTEIDESRPLFNRSSLELTVEQWEALNGLEMTQKEFSAWVLDTLWNGNTTGYEMATVCQMPVWQFLIPDNRIRRDLIEKVFYHVGQMHRKKPQEIRAMAIFLPKPREGYGHNQPMLYPIKFGPFYAGANIDATKGVYNTGTIIAFDKNIIPLAVSIPYITLPSASYVEERIRQKQMEEQERQLIERKMMR